MRFTGRPRRDGFLVVAVSICFLIVALLQALMPFDPRRSPNCRYATLAASTYIRSGLSPYQGPSCNVARAEGGSKEDGTHLYHGVLQPWHTTVTHPPWIAMLL